MNIHTPDPLSEYAPLSVDALGAMKVTVGQTGSNARTSFRSKMTGFLTPESFNDPKHEAFMLKRITDIDVALQHCRKTSVAVQAGGYIGMWPHRLAKSFSVVHTFEPMPENFQCLQANCSIPGIVCHNAVLSREVDERVIFATRKGWGSRIDNKQEDPNAEGFEERTTTTIDALELPCCDAIFLDIEGAELLALEGAMNTIKAFRPVITLEGWNQNVEQYQKFMEKLDYQFVTKVHADMIFRPR